MLVVTANWAIGDGTVQSGPARGAYEAFFADLRRAAWRAGFRRDGTYRPIEAVQMVLAGDTLDGMCSLAWHDRAGSRRDGARPWRGGRRAARVAETVAAGVARSGKPAWRAIGRLLRDGLAVPRADRHGRPVLGSFVAARITICCLVGDRDRPLEATPIAAAAMRRGIHVGVAAGSEHIVAPPCDRAPTVAESIAVDLLAPFAYAVKNDPDLRDQASTRLRSLASAAVAEMPRLVHAWAMQAGAGSVHKAWGRAIREWELRTRTDPPQVAVPFDVVAALAGWLEQAARLPDTPLPGGGDWCAPARPAGLMPGDGGSLPLAVVPAGDAGAVWSAQWTRAVPSAVARIGALPDDPGIIDAA